MDGVVKKYFDQYKWHVQKIGDTKDYFDIDDVALEKLAELEKLYHAMRDDCEENGYTQITQSGYSQIRAEYSIMMKTHEMIMKLGAQFGVTPADRVKLVGAKPKKENKGFNLDSPLKKAM